MINYDSIISAYNDKPTLMEWLKKVEEALKGASATSFSVNKKGDATISFQIDFDDGTSLESGEIILQQGESVTGASIVNGHLILTLTNGDELDAGSVGAVSSFSIDASQHLIVTYQDGTTNDLGAIFNGNVNISGILTASSVSTPILTSSGDSITAQKPVVELMQGYGFTPANRDYIYVGICKNGNKLTCVIFASYTNTNIIYQNTGIGMGKFTIPSSVGQKLTNYTFQTLPILSATTIKGVTDRLSAGIELYAYIRKLSNTEIDILFYPPNDIPANTTMLMRFEFTLLLSDNLAE